MGNYNFTDKEKDLLKVAKLNQDKSISMQKDMKSLGEKWDKTNLSHEEFLSDLEGKLGVQNRSISTGKEEFVRESSASDAMEWDELLASANSKYSDEIGFEDLLGQEDFERAYMHINEINAEFRKKTGLTKQDISFLTLATALQCIRQYVLDPWIKELRKNAGANDEIGRKKNKEPGWYYVETERILVNRVPYDVQCYSDNATIQGFLKGGDHRLMTLGHDPILGWVFGTANIMTGTVTRRDLQSAHVKCVNNKNVIYSLADTLRIFESVLERVTEEGYDGKLALGYAIVREAIHLKSDIATKRSLPLPGIGMLSSELGNKLTKYGIDVASVTTEVTLASLINVLIAMIHYISFDEKRDEKQFYQVRTRKVILYSNLIASTSNVIASTVTKRYDFLDVGGLLVTIARLFSDVRFICKVRDEFVQSKLDEHFQGILDETEELYKTRFGLNKV